MDVWDPEIFSRNRDSVASTFLVVPAETLDVPLLQSTQDPWFLFTLLWSFLNFNWFLFIWFYSWFNSIFFNSLYALYVTLFVYRTSAKKKSLYSFHNRKIQCKFLPHEGAIRYAVPGPVCCLLHTLLTFLTLTFSNTYSPYFFSLFITSKLCFSLTIPFN